MLQSSHHCPNGIMKMNTLFINSPLRERGCHSVLKLLTGLDKAALTVFKLTMISVSSNINTPTTANSQILILNAIIIMLQPVGHCPPG